MSDGHVITTSGLTKYFGSFKAVDDLDLSHGPTTSEKNNRLLRMKRIIKPNAHNVAPGMV